MTSTSECLCIYQMESRLTDFSIASALCQIILKNAKADDTLLLYS